MVTQIKNFLKLFSTKREEAILTCLKNDIELTDENIREVESILKQRKERDAKNLLKLLEMRHPDYKKKSQVEFNGTIEINLFDDID